MQKHPDLDYPDQQVMYFICAKEFGWTVQETDNQPAESVAWLLAMVETYYEVQHEQSS